MINAKLQNIIDTKSAIGNAIVNKGGTITGETPFFNYAAQIDGISTGTPQTIFQASDGSKWARTNAVNLTNVSNNVTSDFNYWQPANNSTSDPILNIGTVGANISGNIQLVAVNQVNIAQYSNIVINDTTGAKYVGYNGYDSQTNPTPTGNTTFNRWLLNNSASGTVIFANATIVNGGTYNGPNSVANIFNLAFINNTARISSMNDFAVNNGFIYVGSNDVRKYNESNLTFVSSTNAYGPTNFGIPIFSVLVNNGFIYVGGYDNTSTIFGPVKKYNESTLAFVSNTPNYNGAIRAMAINNGFIYAGGESIRTLQKFNESTLSFVSNTPSYGGTIRGVVVKDGFVYIGGESTRTVQKFHESNLAFIGNTVSYGFNILDLVVNNGFIYVVGSGNATAGRDIKKYHESNLAFESNSVSYGGDINTLSVNSGFIYIGGVTNTTVQKFYESNLSFVNNTSSYGFDIQEVKTNNGFIYIGGSGNLTSGGDIEKHQEQSLTLDTQTFYTATKIKE